MPNEQIPRSDVKRLDHETARVRHPSDPGRLRVGIWHVRRVEVAFDARTLVRVSVFVGVSLDGFIARQDGSLDFLALGQNEDNGFEAFLETVDAIVMGRKTFETVLTYAEWPYGGKPVVVLSTTLDKARGPPGSSCEIMNGSPAEVLSRLSERGAQHVYVDGGATVQSFLRAGLIHDLTINRAPVLIGSGVPLFGSLLRDVRLHHLGTRVHPSGFVQSEYRVVPG